MVPGGFRQVRAGTEGTMSVAGFALEGATDTWEPKHFCWKLTLDKAASTSPRALALAVSLLSKRL